MENDQKIKQNKKESIWDTIRFALISIIIVIPIRMFIAQPFVVSGASMYPTFHNQDYLIVDQLSYHFENIKRYDVIVFKYPEDTSKFFIKRVIGLPNEKIRIVGADVTIINQENEQGFVLPDYYIQNKSNNEPMYFELKGDEYFVMGDNRSASSDSRYWGPVKKDLILGKAFLRLLPINDISYKPGALKEITN